MWLSPTQFKYTSIQTHSTSLHSTTFTHTTFALISIDALYWCIFYGALLVYFMRFVSLHHSPCIMFHVRSVGISIFNINEYYSHWTCAPFIYRMSINRESRDSFDQKRGREKEREGKKDGEKDRAPIDINTHFSITFNLNLFCLPNHKWNEMTRWSMHMHSRPPNSEFQSIKRLNKNNQPNTIEINRLASIQFHLNGVRYSLGCNIHCIRALFVYQTLVISLFGKKKKERENGWKRWINIGVGREKGERVRFRFIL